METSSLILLVVSCSVSFAIGRTIMYFRGRKRKAQLLEAQKRHEQALRNAPPEPESRNKGKRRRQLQQAEKSASQR